MTSSPSVQALVALLKEKRFHYDNERDLQNGLEVVFKAEGYEYEREHELAPGDIIDFLLFGSVGIEVKIKGSPIEVARQLLRYAGHPKLSEIVLVTGKMSLGRLPDQLLDKPVTVVSLWRSFL